MSRTRNAEAPLDHGSPRSRWPETLVFGPRRAKSGTNALVNSIPPSALTEDSVARILRPVPRGLLSPQVVGGRLSESRTGGDPPQPPEATHSDAHPRQRRCWCRSVPRYAAICRVLGVSPRRCSAPVRSFNPRVRGSSPRRPTRDSAASTEGSAAADTGSRRHPEAGGGDPGGQVRSISLDAEPSVLQGRPVARGSTTGRRRLTPG